MYVKPFYIQPYPIYHALLGSQGNAIILAHPDEPYNRQKNGRFGEAPFPRPRIWLEDAALHTYSTTPLPCKATKPKGKCYSRKTRTKNKRREKGTEHFSEGRDRQARGLSLLQISEGTGAREKGKRELCRKIETITKCESAGVEGGRIKTLASKTPSGCKNVPERATYETHLKLGMDIVSHPMGAMLKPGGESPGISPQENWIKKTEQKRTSPEKSKFETGKTGSTYSRAVVTWTSTSHVRASRFNWRYFESRVQLIYPDGVEGTRNLEHLNLSKSCGEPERAEASSVPGRLENATNTPRRWICEHWFSLATISRPRLCTKMGPIGEPCSKVLLKKITWVTL